MAASNGNGRRFLASAVILLVGLAVLNACAPASSPAASGGTPTSPFELTIVHSNDTWGYLDPCG